MVSLGRTYRAWLYIVAAGLASVALHGHNADAHSNNAGVGKRHQAPSPQSQSSATLPKKQPYHFPKNCDQPESQDEANLCFAARSAQAAERGAEWTKNTAIIGGVGTLAVFFTLIATAWAVWAAQRSALAAERAVEALPLIERAYLYPVIVSPGEIGRLIRDGSTYFLDDVSKDDVRIPETTEVSFRIKNYGKTPAILKSVAVWLDVAPAKHLTNLAVVNAILEEGGETEAIIHAVESGPSHNQAKRILSHTAHICFEGLITFIDVWGKERTTEFYFKWDITARNWVLQWARDPQDQR